MADDLLPKLGQLALGGAAAPSAGGASPPPWAAGAPPPPPTPPKLGQLALGDPRPLGAALDPLFAARLLCPVDLCTLACVNKDFSVRVRHFWAQAEEAPPGSHQARFLRADERGEEFYWVSFTSTWPKEVLAAKPVRIERKLALWWLQPHDSDCHCCGVAARYNDPTNAFPFDARGGQPLALCYGCFRDAGKTRAPAHSRAAWFRLAPCKDLVRLYLTPLPLSIVESAAVDLWPILAGAGEPLASVRRVAAYSLMRHTPRLLHEHWRLEKMAGWA